MAILCWATKNSVHGTVTMYYMSGIKFIKVQKEKHICSTINYIQWTTHCITVHQYFTFTSGQSISLSLLMVKLNQKSSRLHDHFHYNEKTIWGGGEGSQQVSSCTHTENFLDFLRKFRKLPKNFWNCPFFRPEDISALGKWKVTIKSPENMFRSEQGVNPGSEPQNDDDILRKQKVFSQSTLGLWLKCSPDWNMT